MLNNIKRTYLIVTVITVVLTSYFCYVMFKYPYVGVLVENKGHGVEVVEIDPLTWGAEHLNVGDIILKVNGESPDKFSSINNWNMLEQFETIEVSQNGKVNVFNSYVNFDTQMVFQIIIPVIVVILTIFLSHLIIKDNRDSRKDEKSAIYLILFLFTIALAYVSAGSSARGDSLARFTCIFFMNLVPITYLQYVYHYFIEVNSKWFSYKWIRFMYGVLTLNVIVMGMKLFKIVEINGEQIKTFNLISFLSLFIITYFLIFKGSKKASYKSQKYLLKVILISSVLAIAPFLVLYVLPYVLFKIQVFSAVILAGFLLIIPISLVYQYMVTKIYDIEFFVGRLKYYAFLSIVPALIGLILVIATRTDNPNVYSVRVFLFLYILIIATLYFKETVDFKFKFNRFSEKYNYHSSIMTYTEKIRSASDTEQVVNELSKKLIKYLLVDKVCLIQIDKYKNIIMDTSNNVVLEHYYKETLKTTDSVGSIIEVDKGFVFNIGESNGIKYVLIALAPLNTPRLTRDEIEWLKSLAYFTNVTLESFNKIEALVKHLEELQSDEGNNPEWLNKILLNLEEKQRSELAKDLHDSVLQDLLGVKRQVEMLRTDYKKMNSEAIDNEAVNIIRNVNNTIDITRKTCHELRPQILFDLGLEQALKKLPKDYAMEDCEIKVTTSHIYSDLIDEDMQMNMYRISQELLNNARKHSKAKNVKLIVVRIKEKFVLHYEDDGVGANTCELRKEGSMGLSGMEERVRLLDGSINIETEPNKGFKVVIEL